MISGIQCDSGIKELCYQDRLKKLKLTTLETIGIRGDLIDDRIELIKLTQIADIFFKTSANATTIRGHNFKFFKQQCRLNSRKFLLSMYHRELLSFVRINYHKKPPTQRHYIFKKMLSKDHTPLAFSPLPFLI